MAIGAWMALLCLGLFAAGFSRYNTSADESDMEVDTTPVEPEPSTEFVYIGSSTLTGTNGDDVLTQLTENDVTNPDDLMFETTLIEDGAVITA